MNFELKTFDLAGSAAEKCDALIVLLGLSFKPGKDVLSGAVAQAMKAGDLELKAGKTLSLYRPVGIAATRVVLAGIGDGSAREIRQGVAAAVAAIKAGQVKKLTLCFASAPKEDALRSAVMAVAEASYVYTSTKSKPEPRVIQRVVVALPDAGLKPIFAQTVAAVTGIEYSKEWAITNKSAKKFLLKIILVK